MESNTNREQEDTMSDSFTVIESTPGYMPDDDEPPTFDNYADAVEYLNERAAEYVDDADANYRVEYGIASQDNLAAVIVWDDDKMHDLGRVIQIVRDEPDDDDEPDTPERTRLEELRTELRAERISWGELAELQSLAEHIDPSDVELLEAAAPKRCGAWHAETHTDRGAIDCGCGWGAFCELSAKYVGPEPHSFTIEQARSILGGTAGYETR